MAPIVSVGAARPALDERLSAELDVVNAARTAPTPPAVELTVEIREDDDLVAGLSGWTWAEAAGIAMTWVSEEHRGTGLGATLLRAFEDEAVARGCRRVFVTSFTFQAPGFYERHGYTEIFRWDGVPVAGQADVHFRKELGAG